MLQEGFFTGYDPGVTAAMINSFSTAALRMGHTLIRNDFVLLNSRFQRMGFGDPSEIPTRTFFDPSRFFVPGGNVFGGILIGLFRTRSQQVDP